MMSDNNQSGLHSEISKAKGLGKKVLKVALYAVVAFMGLIGIAGVLGAEYAAGMVLAAPIGLAAWFFRRKLNAFYSTAAIVAMALIVWLGVSTQNQTEKARSLGFTSSDEMEEAAEAGFSDKASYEKHLAALAAAEKAKTDAAANRAKAAAAAEAAEKQREADEAKRQWAAMLNDAKALDDKYDMAANIRCGAGANDYLRSIALHDFSWDDEAKGFFGVKFGSYLVKVDQPGVLTMVSDYAKLQNGFGAFTRIKLFCRYDTQSDKVLEYYHI